MHCDQGKVAAVSRGASAVAPADVLYDDKLGDAVIDALRIVATAQGDPVPSANLSEAVRDHAGFGELARQLFPDPPATCRPARPSAEARFEVPDRKC